MTSLSLAKDQCYKALLAKDARFDGVFFVGVKTTNIYCRPICSAKKPKLENCTFFSSAAQAEASGFRPCIRCRPELAPGYEESAIANDLVVQALEIFHDDPSVTSPVGFIAHELGISERHLARIFKQKLGVSPQQFFITKRLLHAKLLLFHTSLSVQTISEVAGFGTVGRLNALFKERYSMSPTDLKKQKTDDSSSVALSYRPPYDWDAMMNFLQSRTLLGIDGVTNQNTYVRALNLRDKSTAYVGWIELMPEPQNNRVILRVSQSLERVLMQVIEGVRRVFDLDLWPQQLPFDHHEEGGGEPYFGRGVRLPGAFDAFEMSVRAILGQQISVPAARTLANRMVQRLGTSLETTLGEIPHLGQGYLFPSPKLIVELGPSIYEVLGQLGIIRSRSGAILALAKAIHEGTVSFSKVGDPAELYNNLLKLPGIGHWTASYIVMRALSWPDVYLETDIGVRNALKKMGIEDTQTFVQAYKPYRSYLVMALWHSLRK